MSNYQITEERFEAWLLSQPDDMIWNYSDPTRCVVCDYLSCAGFKHPKASFDCFSTEALGAQYIPKKIVEALEATLGGRGHRKDPGPKFIEARNLKAAWLKLTAKPTERITAPELVEA